MVTVTYAISVCNEAEELHRLLTHLLPLIQKEDEVIILSDEDKVTNDVIKVISQFNEPGYIKHISFPLLNDFAGFKNNFTRCATREYIFSIDADEIPSQILIENLPYLLEQNKDIDLFWVPRINIVNGITQDDILRWGWVINNLGYINHPDKQARIFKNNGKIKWVGKVHEKLVGNETESTFPWEETEDFCIFHEKSIEKQHFQNEYYSTI